VNAERKSLSGEVEVDEALVGGVQKGGKRGRGVGKISFSGICFHSPNL